MNIAGRYAGAMYPIPRPLDPRDFLIEPDVGYGQANYYP
jgi:hypothetical protein